MAYTMHIIDQESGDGFDVSTLVHNITHSTTLEGQAGKLTFVLEKDPNEILHISMGSVVKFWCEDCPVFYGYVFKMKTTRKGDYTITAYDQMRYLQNHDYLLIENMNLQDVFKKICEQLKLTYKIFGNAKINPEQNLDNHLFADKSYFDILQYAINETNARYISTTVNKDDGTRMNYFDPELTDEILGVKYFIRDNFGTLELNDLASNVKFRKTGIDGDMTRAWTGNEWYYYDENQRENLEPLIIGDESLLTDYEYNLDIDSDTYNELYLMETIKQTSNTKDKNKTNKKLVLAGQSSEAIKKWGLLRKIVNIKGTRTEQELQEYLKLSLLEGAQISKTLSINALGYNGVNAGDGFFLRLKKLGVEEMMYVISATHNYDADKHTMKLEVSTNKNLTEVLK